MPTPTPNPRQHFGPKGLDVLRFVRDFQRDGLVAIERLMERYGDPVVVDGIVAKAIFVAHPDHVHHVLVKQRDNYLKMPGNRNAGRFFGDPMQLNNGEYAQRMRRLMAPVFQPNRLAEALADGIVRTTIDAVDAWSPGPRPDVAQDLMDLALHIAVQTHFGVAPGAEARAAGKLVVDSMAALGDFMMVPLWVPTKSNRQHLQATEALNALVARQLRSIKSQHAPASSVLALLAQMRDENGQGMTDQQLRDEIVTMIAAGYASVGIAMTQTLRYIAENTDPDERLAQEVLEVVGTGLPQPRHFEQLTHLNLVLKESLRLFPPAGMLGRNVVADDTIGGVRIPAGAKVFVIPWVTHRNPQFYERPASFEPERWTSDFKDSLPICAYLPFGRGPRACIGATLSNLMLELTLATILQRYRLRATRKTSATHPTWPMLLASGGLQVILEKRQPTEH